MRYWRGSQTCLLNTMGLLMVVLTGCADLGTAREAHNAGEYETAVQHWEALSDFGVPEAQVGLGRAYLTGKGVPQNYGRAFELFEQAAKHEDRIAFFELGRLYEKGDAVAQDGQKAMHYYLRASDLGYVRGDYYIARLYERGGGGIDRDLETARKYYRKALDRGMERAEEDLRRLTTEK